MCHLNIRMTCKCSLSSFRIIYYGCVEDFAVFKNQTYKGETNTLNLLFFNKQELKGLPCCLRVKLDVDVTKGSCHGVKCVA